MDKSAVVREQIQDHVCSLKIDKAAKFLSIPDIKKMDNNAVKVHFLKSKGLNGKEISEAFNLLKLPQNKNATTQFIAPKLVLNEVANVENNRTSDLTQYSNGSGRESSLFVGFCKKLILYAGIYSTCYYLFQRLLRWREERKKKDRNIIEELNQIKNDLRKILMDLRQQETMKQNQNELMAEVNSIKAILVGRQNFQEKLPTKATLPSWQLTSTKEKSTEKIDSAGASSESNSTESQSAEKFENEGSVSMSILPENSDLKIPFKNDNGMHSDETVEKKMAN